MLPQAEIKTAGVIIAVRTVIAFESGFINLSDALFIGINQTESNQQRLKVRTLSR
jgi:hypothetical protein